MGVEVVVGKAGGLGWINWKSGVGRLIVSRLNDQINGDVEIEVFVVRNM